MKQKRLEAASMKSLGRLVRYMLHNYAAAFAVVVWFVVTSGFSYYMGHVSRYSIIYGSLAAIMMLMLWFYLTGAVLILGGELNHILIQLRRERLEHQGGAL